MKRFAINGNPLTKSITGMERYAIEIIKELDRICGDLDIVLVLPKGTEFDIKLNNIKKVYYGGLRGEIWEQICFAAYLYLNKSIGVEFGSRISLLKPSGIACLYDIKNSIHKEYIKQSVRYLSMFKNFMICRFAKQIVTISEYSKQSIIEKYKVDPERISIIYPAWQHIVNIDENENIFNQFPEIQKGNYFFSLGSISKHKNLKWIIENASNYPDYQFVVSGKINKRLYGTLYESKKIHNFLYLGYVDDASIKTLMRHCKAFLFPSLFEGFGLPPLEAISLGTTAVVSNSTCLPEIYEKSVHYIDPYDSTTDLDNLLNESVELTEKVLKKYSWKKSAMCWYELLKQH